jgi:hypothetical protein
LARFHDCRKAPVVLLLLVFNPDMFNLILGGNSNLDTKGAAFLVQDVEQVSRQCRSRSVVASPILFTAEFGADYVQAVFWHELAAADYARSRLWVRRCCSGETCCRRHIDFRRHQA